MKYFKATDEWSGDEGPVWFRSEDGRKAEVWAGHPNNAWIDTAPSLGTLIWAYQDEDNPDTSWTEVLPSDLPNGVDP